MDAMYLFYTKCIFLFHSFYSLLKEMSLTFPLLFCHSGVTPNFPSGINKVLSYLICLLTL